MGRVVGGWVLPLFGGVLSVEWLLFCALFDFILSGLQIQKRTRVCFSFFRHRFSFLQQDFTES